jgi:hypothetical protein
MRDEALDKNNALLMVYESIKHRTSLSANEYISAVLNWEVLPLIENSEVIGGVLVKQNEIHVGYGKTPKSSIKQYIKSILNFMIEKYGFVVTTVQKENEKGLVFCKRLGFFETNEINGFIELRCNRSNYK